MVLVSPDLLIKELEHQIKTRRKMAEIRLKEYLGEDPINALPLTEYQRGLAEGRIITWVFLEKMLPDIVKYIERKTENEAIQKED